MHWYDLKKDIHAGKSSSVAELKQFWKEDRATVPPQPRGSYHKCLIAILAAKGGTTSR